MGEGTAIKCVLKCWQHQLASRFVPAATQRPLSHVVEVKLIITLPPIHSVPSHTGSASRPFSSSTQSRNVIWREVTKHLWADCSQCGKWYRGTGTDSEPCEKTEYAGDHREGERSSIWKVSVCSEVARCPAELSLSKTATFQPLSRWTQLR